MWKKVNWLKLALTLCLVIVLLCHLILIKRFNRQPPRLEILNIQTLPRQAIEQLQPYGLQQQGQLWVILGQGKTVFLADEVADILTDQGLEGFEINDRSQALDLAWQSIRLYLFVLDLLALVLLFRWLCWDAKKAAIWWREQLKLAYPGQIVEQNGEQMLIRCLKWTLSLLAMGLLIGFAVSCKFQVPFRWTPPEYILDWQYYLHLQLPQLSQSAYEQLCRRVLPVCYGMAGIEIGCSLALAVLWVRQGNRERGEG